MYVADVNQGASSSAHVTGFERFAAFIVRHRRPILLLAVLAMGVIGLFRKKPNPQRSNLLMRWRVVLQFVALGLIMLAAWAMQR